MNGSEKRYQWTGVWTRQVNGVAISENFTFRSDDWKEVTDKRLEALSMAPSSKSFPDDEGNVAHIATQKPDPICPVHNTPMTLRPAGVSKKTGKPYSAFWSCGVKNDDGTFCKERGN